MGKKYSLPLTGHAVGKAKELVTDEDGNTVIEKVKTTYAAIDKLDAGEIETGDVKFREGSSIETDVHCTEDVEVDGITHSRYADIGEATIATLKPVHIRPANVGQTEVDTTVPIIETMTGYSFIPGNLTGVTITDVYAGVSKNGNKLTVVHFFKISRSADAVNYGVVGSFGLPADVMSKLVATPLQTVDSALKSFKVDAFYRAQSAVSLYSICLKSTTSINFFLYSLSSLTVDTEYQIRMETTFLLSENLVAQQ